jgi:hypothetical protein
MNTTFVEMNPTMDETGKQSEQVIRIEVVQNSDNWWSGSDELHFPEELSVRVLLSVLGLTFVCGLGVSVVMIAKWWQLNNLKLAAKPEGDFYKIVA